MLGKLLRVLDPNVTDKSRRVIFGRFNDSITSPHLSQPGNFNRRTTFINSELYKYICGKNGIVKGYNEDPPLSTHFVTTPAVFRPGSIGSDSPGSGLSLKQVYHYNLKPLHRPTCEFRKHPIQ